MFSYHGRQFNHQIKWHLWVAPTLTLFRLFMHPLARSPNNVYREFVFFITDSAVNEAAKIIRLLHVTELRELQTRINEAIVAVQTITANPKTDQSLGRVGVWHKWQYYWEISWYGFFRPTPDLIYCCNRLKTGLGDNFRGRYKGFIYLQSSKRLKVTNWNIKLTNI